jgi:putative membrane protein
MFRYGPFIGGWPWFGLASTVIFWVAVIIGVVLLIRYLNRTGRPHTYGPARHGWPGPPPYPGAVPTPEQILAERFARGEIDEQEFRQRMATLRGTDPYQASPPQAPPPPPPPPQGSPPPPPAEP